ncbi:hypothetical protein GCM10027341_01300 [Spirosoma knui]
MQTIYLTEDGTENGKAARWNIILGDNGIGKTTVLKAIFFGHHVMTSDTQINHQLFKTHTLKRGDFIHSEMRLLSRIRWSYCVNNISETGFSIELKDNVYEHDGVARFYDGKNPLRDIMSSIYNNNPSVQGFGANRRSDEINTQQTGASALSLFDDNVSLIGAETWLMQAEYVSLKNKQNEGQYEKVRKILLKILEGQVHDIFTNVDLGVTPTVYFKTNFGNVRQRDLSLGYKTLIAWMVDFAKGLLDRYPDSENPLAEPAVCLVDEIDLHLHPKFQRNIIQFLTATFPNTQFIVTAHSPLIVLAAEERPLDANIILLKREGDQTVVANDPVDVSNWSVDQILNSDLFGHVPARSESLTQLQTERDKLLAKQKLTKKESARLAELDEKIGFVPSGQDQTEIQAETIIQRLADVLRQQQQVQ